MIILSKFIGLTEEQITQAFQLAKEKKEKDKEKEKETETTKASSSNESESKGRKITWISIYW